MRHDFDSDLKFHKTLPQLSLLYPLTTDITTYVMSSKVSGMITEKIYAKHFQTSKNAVKTVSWFPLKESLEPDSTFVLLPKLYGNQSPETHLH